MLFQIRKVHIKQTKDFNNLDSEINHVSQQAFDVASAGGILLLSDVWGVLN